MRPRPPQGDAPSLEGPLRTDLGAIKASVPSLVDRAIRDSAILTRSGPDTFVFARLNACGRPWARAPRPPFSAALSDRDG